MKEKTDRLDFIKSKNFYSAKDNAKRIIRQVTDWKIYATQSNQFHIYITATNKTRFFIYASIQIHMFMA